MRRAVLFFICLCFSGTAALAVERTEYDSTAQEFLQAAKTFRSAMETKQTARVEMPARDPMQPLLDAEDNIVYSEAQSSELVIQGIVESGGSKMALINGKFYAQGASINDCRILEIRSNGVLTQNADNVIFIPLYPGTHREPNSPAE